MGTSGFGIINIGLAVISYVMLFTDLGLPVFGTRHIAAEEKHPARLAGQITTTRLLLAVAAFAFTIIGLYFWGINDRIFWLTVTYLVDIFPAVLFPDWYFKGKQAMGIVALGVFLHRLTILVFVLFFVFTPDDLFMAAWGWVIANAIQAIFLWTMFGRQHHSIQFRWQLAKFKDLLTTAFPLGTVSFISQAAIQFPVLYLGWFATADDIGIFSAALRLIFLLLIFDRIFYNVFFPAISRCARKAVDRLPEVVLRVLKIVTTAALTICLLAIFSANFFITFLFSHVYVDAIPLFQILTAYFVFTLINSVIGFTLIGAGYEKKFTRAFLCALAFMLISIFILQHQFGITGVMVSLVLYHFTAMFFMTFYLKRHLGLFLLCYIMRPVFCTFVLILPCLLYLNLHWFFSCGLIAFAGMPLIGWLSGIRKNDIDYLRELIH